jgi:1,4-alpha-glucan branching enzyme
MITKHYLKSRPVCKTTFTLPKEIEAQSVCLVGDFNNWDTAATPMVKKRGLFEITVELTTKREYHFRYLVNGTEWHNDDKADRYSLNSFGTYNCVVSV